MNGKKLFEESSMKTALISLLLCLVFFTALQAQIQSTPAGGRWHFLSTWVGGVVPGPLDDVIINGVVRVYPSDPAQCNNLTITSAGSVLNVQTADAQITINGNLINQGILAYNPNGFNLTVYCAGHVTNSATVLVFNFVFTGAANQNINNDGGSFYAQTINDTNAASPVTLYSNLSLNNVNIDLNNSELILYTGVFTACHIYMTGGRITNATLIGGSGASITFSAGAYLENVYATTIVFHGTVLVKDNVSVDFLINQGNLCNHPDGNYTLTINVQLNNLMQIFDHPVSGSLAIWFYGNLHNYASISNSSISLQGTGVQTVYLADPAPPYSCGTFHSIPGSNPIQMISSLRFVNCDLSLSQRPLQMYQGSSIFDLSLDGGKLYQANLVTNGFSTLNLSNGAYLQSVTGEDHILEGTVEVLNEVEFQEVVNNGILQDGGGIYNVYFNGNMTNNGTLQTNPAGVALNLHFLTDFTNLGTVNLNAIFIEGTVNQLITLINPVTTNHFYLESMIGNSVWYKDGILTPYTGNYIDINPLDTGVWQPVNGGVQGRLITLTNTLYFPPPQNLVIEPSGNNVLLRWDEVDGAVFYTLYYSNTPEGPHDWSVVITDPVPGDAIVAVIVSTTEARRFFWVTAQN